MTNMLENLGVDKNLLSQDEKTALREKGYISLGKLLSDEDLKRISQRINTLINEEQDQMGSELFDSPYIRHPKEAGADRLADLVNKGPIFDRIYTHPRLLAAISYVLGEDIKLSSLNYRAAKPGQGAQKLHADWHESVPEGDFKVCNSIWLIDDFTSQNGATRVVPGTHKMGRLPEEVIQDPWDSHPEEVLCTAPAGTVFVVNSHTWHGGTTNHTNEYRRCIHSYFCRGDQPQQTDQVKFIRKDTMNRLDPAVLALLGV
ncbi:MAG: phytanoyl-CoA dioxygenase [Saprospiraceae bacterium]|nr:phytanoyl-CoA dioxygenase [Saprospiraceae bacterium]